MLDALTMIYKCILFPISNTMNFNFKYRNESICDIIVIQINVQLKRSICPILHGLHFTHCISFLCTEIKHSYNNDINLSFEIYMFLKLMFGEFVKVNYII